MASFLTRGGRRPWRPGRLGLGVKGDVHVLHDHFADGHFGQAVEVAAGELGAGGPDVLHGQAAQPGGVVVHRHGLPALDVVAVAVGVAEIEHIDDEGGFHAVHLHVAEHQPVDDGGLAPSAAGLDPQAPVGVVHQALGDHHVLDAARHLAADDDAAVALVQQAVADDGVLQLFFSFMPKKTLLAFMAMQSSL